MVRLTEEMVAARTRSSDCTSVKKLNCWGTELTDVSILRKMKKVEVLSLSVNNIKTLADFQNCIDLKDLFVRKNNISDINEVCYLQGLPNLRNLWLGENPCAEFEGYRMAVLRALPNLEKLDDKVVTPEEVQTSLLKGKILIHPLSNDASKRTQYEQESPEIEEQEIEPEENNSSSDEQCQESPQIVNEYQDNDRRNANYNSGSPVQYNSPNNRFMYEDYNERTIRNNADYADVNQRVCASSPRVSYHQQENDDRRNEYEDSSRCISGQSKRGIYQQNIEREETNQSPAWTKCGEKEKRKTHFQPQYQRRPVTRNSNILSAVLCLVKELDYPSLEVVEMTVRNRMDELEE